MADIVGVRVRDRVSGLVTLEITDRLTRVIGSFNSGGTDGSISPTGLSLGSGWAAVMEAQPQGQSTSNLYSYPIVSISGGTISWTFPTFGGQTRTIVPCDIIYGVY